MPEEKEEEKKSYDLEERTAVFGENVIEFAKKSPVTPVTRRLIDQLLGQEPVLERITVKRMTLFPGKNSNTRSAHARRRHGKQNFS